MKKQLNNDLRPVSLALRNKKDVSDNIVTLPKRHANNQQQKAVSFLVYLTKCEILIAITKYCYISQTYPWSLVTHSFMFYGPMRRQLIVL